MKSISGIAKDINNYVIHSSNLVKIEKYLKIKVMASPMVNFRDALAHYIRFHDAASDEEKINQEASINEHLSRGLKDICVHIVGEMKDRIFDALKELSITRVTERNLRKKLYAFKELEIYLRKDSKMVSVGAISTNITKLKRSITETKNMFNSYNIPFKVDPAVSIT
jgi:hypothetical protein